MLCYSANNVASSAFKNVLILIVMEYALLLYVKLRLIMMIVGGLILIVMEYALLHKEFYKVNDFSLSVLILIVMEYALLHYVLKWSLFLVVS